MGPGCEFTDVGSVELTNDKDRAVAKSKKLFQIGVIECDGVGISSVEHGPD